jgi:Uma2 family endonuclease
MSAVQAKRLTAEDLLAMGHEGKSFELVNGELVEKNVSLLSGRVEAILLRKVDEHCTTHDLGPVWPGTQGIRCFPDDPHKIRKPDTFFVKKERFQSTYWQEGFLTIAPDLAAEVISSNDLATEVGEKVEEYLAVGIALVWVVDPEIRTVVIHRADGSVSKLRENDELTGENVVQGFRCKVADLFPPT